MPHTFSMRIARSFLAMLFVAAAGCQPPQQQVPRADEPPPNPVKAGNADRKGELFNKTDAKGFVTHDLTPYGIRVLIDLPSDVAVNEAAFAKGKLEISKGRFSSFSFDLARPAVYTVDEIKQQYLTGQGRPKPIRTLADEPGTFAVEIDVAGQREFAVHHRFVVAGETYDIHRGTIFDLASAEQILTTIRSIRQTDEQRKANDRDAVTLAEFEKAGGELQYGGRRFACLRDGRLDDQINSLKHLRFGVVSLGDCRTRYASESILRLKDIATVKAIWLSNRPVDDELAATVGKLSGLEELVFLTETRVTHIGLQSLSGLRTLRVLRVPGWNVKAETGPVNFFAEMTKLRELDVSGLPINDANMTQFAAMTDLRKLGLRETQITDAGLVHLQNLQGLIELDVSGTKITGKGLQNLRGSFKLKRIVIPRSISGDAIESLRANFPALVVERAG